MVKLLVIALFLCVGSSAQSALTFVVANETVPAGGWVQIKVFAATPCRITSGTLTLKYDPAIFGDVRDAAVFSATGDAWKYPNVYTGLVSADFVSPSGGIGQLPDFPVLVVSMPVAAGLARGSTTSVTVDVSASSVTGLDGNPYSLTAVPGTITVGGTLSIQSVTPGGGLLPAGTVVQIAGTGFDASTTAALDGVSVPAVHLANPQQINVTLGATAELTGKHLHLANAAGEQADYFSASSASGFVFPLATYRDVVSPWVGGDRWFEVLNPTLSPVMVTAWQISTGMSTILESADVPPGGLYQFGGGDFVGQSHLTASAPIRLLACVDSYPSLVCDRPVPEVEPFVTEPSNPVVWNWQVGTEPPKGGGLLVPNPKGAQMSVSVSPSAQQWLDAKLTPGNYNYTLTLTPNVSGLSAGTYSGTVTIACVPPPSSALQTATGIMQVELNVSAAPFIVANGSLEFETGVGSPSSLSQPVSVSAASGATGSAKFQVSAQTDSGGNWLSVKPSGGQTPGTLTVSANPAGLVPRTYTGHITIQGPANAVTVPAQFVVDPEAPPAQPFSPSSIAFYGDAGCPPPYSKSVRILQGSGYSASVQTQSGGNWLTVFVDQNTVSVTASSAGLAPGTYQGTVVLTSPSNPALQVPVTLTVLPPPARLSASPESISVTVPAGQNVTKTLTVTSPDGPAVFGSNGVYCTPTPATLEESFGAPWPGTYYGSVPITWTGGSLSVRFTLSVTASPLAPPVLAGIVNTASELPGAISPGEMITLFGTGIGPGPTAFSFDQSGKVPDILASTQVLIDGTTAPVLYASATQVNAIVPYEVGTTGTATVEVVSNGFQSELWGVPLTPAAPGVFAAGSIGVGQAAVLNQDGSPNGAPNPAARGSVVRIFGTGEGATTPANFTGGVTPGGGNSTTLPVKVTMGGIEAAVTYRGSAPGEVAGVMQVNAIVPAGVGPGAAVPVIVTVGEQASQSGITITVR